MEENSFRNIGSTPHVLYEDADRNLVSFDTLPNPVHDVQHSTLESQTRSTVPEYDAAGKNERSYPYYYWGPTLGTLQCSSLRA